jgi:hypothetical protein
VVVYRDDRQALQHRVESISREADELRRENEAMRVAVSSQQITQLSLPNSAIYKADHRLQPLAERSRLAMHSMRTFPIWAVGILNVLTFGLFPLIHFGLMHNRLPQAAHNDPSAGKAIGFQFIPYFNLYWMFFSSLRLADRLNLQLRLRNRRERAPKGLLIAACVTCVIPYFAFVAIPTIWTIAVCLLQSTANKVAELSPADWDATEVGRPSPQGLAMAPVAQAMPPAMVAQQASAQRLVSWSQRLGWGGLGMLFIATPVAGATLGLAAAAVVGVASGASVLVGAIVGQVGRGMQGRAI